MLTRPIREDVEDIYEEYVPYLDSLAKKRVLITGGNGFIPSYLVDTIAFFNEVHPLRAIEVTVVNKNPVTPDSRLSHLLGNPHLTFETQDVSLPFVPRVTPQIIIHAASRANPAYFKQDPLNTFDANVKGTRTLLDAAVKSHPEAFLFFSSSEIYGNPPPEALPTPESYGGNVNTLGGLACYAEGKRASETLCGIFSNQFGIPTKIARIFHTYGPGIRNDGKTITDMITQAFEDGEIRLKSSGSEKRAYMYVGDCARALFKILEKGNGGEAYNVGDDTSSISVGNMARLIRDKINPSIEIRGPTVLSEGEFIQDRAPNITRLRALGFSPKTSLDEGLERLLRHYRESKRA